MKIGFTSYDVAEAPPTIQEIISSLTNAQKVGVLNSFASGVGPVDVKATYNIPTVAVFRLYAALVEIEAACSNVMRSGTPPVSAAALSTAVANQFSDDFTGAQVSAIVNKIIQYSKSNGTGDWAFYSTNVII